MSASKKILTVVSIIFLCVISWFLVGSSQLRPADDDQYFLHAIDNRSLISFLHERYLTWTGRIPIETVMVKTIGDTYFWKIMIPLSALILAASISRLMLIKSKHETIIATSFSVLLTCLIDRSVFNDAVMWIAGFYNYLLPASVASLSILIFRGGGITKSFIASFLMAYAVANEQISVLFFIYAIFLIYKRLATKNGRLNDIIAFLAIPLASSIFCLTAPGNANRFETEKTFLLDFSGFSFVDKVSHGFATYANHTLSGTNFLMLAIFILVGVFSVIKAIKKEGSDYNIISFIAISGALLFIVNIIVPLNVIFNNSGVNVLNAAMKGNPTEYLKYFLAMLIALLLMYYSYLRGFFLLGVFLIVSGMAVVVMVGLSPAIWADRPRVFFIPDVMLIAYAIRTLSK